MAKLSVAAVLLMVALGVAQASQPVTTTANLPKDVLAGASAGVTAAAIQNAAGGGGSASRATGVGNAASQVVSLSTSNLLAAPRDLQNNAIQQRTQGSIQTAAGGGIPASNPADAANAIRGVQAVATGSGSRQTRGDASVISTQAAIQSGTAEQATTVGQVGTSLTGGSGILTAGLTGGSAGAAAGIPAPVPSAQANVYDPFAGFTSTFGDFPNQVGAAANQVGAVVTSTAASVGNTVGSLLQPVTSVFSGGR